MIKKIFFLVCVFYVVSGLFMLKTDVSAKEEILFDIQKVPREMNLYDGIPLIAVRFHVKEGEYTMKAYKTFGSPTLTIDQSRDVFIRGLADQRAKPFVTISVYNPRSVYTTGTQSHESAVLPEGDFTVFFAKSDRLIFLDLEVVRGPDKGIRKMFYLNQNLMPLK